ncbi:hypothetical protein D9619_004728 [Psilocybe cf. subviscida]|uniref:GPI ethanolamine phosphate transferase 3 n=1 Tax=Psilocybe cf. subviscida TaxID=2480587 RepID=A0A8H5F807_9AGAR|nr:hypothetical protein D9619_004728 [Psilocybe cf. subviscida]
MNTLWSIILLLIHIFAIKTFTSGFLQKRQPFLNITESANTAHSSLVAHRRAIILVLDALRFDFLAPNPPHPQSPFQHNVLTLPRDLQAKCPHQSFLFNAFADPPTTTLQRIKAITTGSLPTFVDVGNNLGASSIPDDSLLKQAKLAGKKIAFLGDNTWMSVFPNEFAENLTFAYNGLNVEDLHTVDDGVVEHLFPLMEDRSKPFDVLITHFLGVDHVGHRVGADHPRMRAKLQHMENILKRVVDLLDEETLLVVLGDHGMDHLGSHCGDSTLETSSAMWIFSKTLSSTNSTDRVPPTLSTNTTFPGSSSPHRSIQQIDILPTLSLLLGLPIPFNNLGTVIPELFPGEQQLHAALEINAQQIDRFMDTYRQGPQGSDLDLVWDTLRHSRASIREHRKRVSGHARREGQVDLDLTEALAVHTRLALAACRQIWARFDFHKMAVGLVLMGLAMTINLYLLQRTGGPGKRHPKPSSTSLSSLAAVFVLAAHACTLAIPALTVWEDRIVALLLHACVLPHTLTALTSIHPSPKSSSQQPPENSIASDQIQAQRQNLLRLCFAFLACIHLAALSTICREEQQPYCRVTFYSTSPGSGTAAPLFALVLSIPASLSLPSFVGKLLARRVRAASSGGPLPVRVPGAAAWFLPYILRPALVGGNLYWILEWADSGSVFGNEWCSALRLARTWVARVAFGTVLVGAAAVLCLTWLQRVPTARQHPQSGSVSMMVTSNNYLCIFLAIFSIAYIPSQLTGQLVFSLCLIALLLHLEILRESRILAESGKEGHGPTSLDIMVLPLLGILAFYGTGHQATITSLQLKSAFLVHPTVVYPYSRMTLVLNSLGSFIFAGFAAPLLALWTCDKESERRRKSFGDVMLLVQYCTMILCASMAGAVFFTSNYLVWKVAAPRYLLCAMMLVIIDFTTVMGWGLVNWVAGRVIQDVKD